MHVFLQEYTLLVKAESSKATALQSGVVTNPLQLSLDVLSIHMFSFNILQYNVLRYWFLSYYEFQIFIFR